jgi:hypothetical protein
MTPVAASPGSYAEDGLRPGRVKERPSALRSIIAGSTAGAVEIGVPFFFFGPPSVLLGIRTVLEKGETAAGENCNDGANSSV